jgi:UDP-glucose 4-epimerase
VSVPETVAITGLRTFLGQQLAVRLAARSPRLRVIGLDLQRPYRLEGRVTFQRIDLTEPTANVRLAELLERERVDALVHAAFRRDPTPDLEYDHELETIGSLHVLQACAAAKVKRLVLASSTMLYGARPDNPNFLHERHPLRGHPDAHCVLNRVEVESLVADWCARHPEAEVAVLRHAWIMGATYWDRVARYFARPVVATVLGYDPLMQFVHERDCIDAFEKAVVDGIQGVYNVVAPEVLPLSTILRLAGKRILPVPTALLFRMGTFASRAQSGDAPPGFYDYLRYLWVADGEKGWDTFGEPFYTTREAWMSFVSSRRMRRYR